LSIKVGFNFYLTKKWCSGRGEFSTTSEFIKQC